ncbi:hypothetical protein K490DRAFT_61508 [Saccharata proteae CBS 121410]|uniref:C3H1-type domain-containing protein n=1 Tax=Saccharata proteae CBS 121410 TaxID=1314787 RepID=A0A9P4M3P5_9PEZI|nr:hypothetical protein K490DRAFT_61508 [Saccharata proteae CBS 121410]
MPASSSSPAKSSADSTEICQFFAKNGWCKWGFGCDHRHVRNAAPASGQKEQQQQQQQQQPKVSKPAPKKTDKVAESAPAQPSEDDDWELVDGPDDWVVTEAPANFKSLGDEPVNIDRKKAQDDEYHESLRVEVAQSLRRAQDTSLRRMAREVWDEFTSE